MTFLSKLIVSSITIFTTLFGSIWACYEYLDKRMDEKVDRGRNEVVALVQANKSERDGILKSQDEKIAIQFNSIKEDLTDIKEDIRILVKQRAKVEEIPSRHYTKNEKQIGEIYGL